MTTGRAIHRADDGTETDITEGIQALYDLVISSMDWGSGFWSWEDALPVAQVGHLLGFERIAEVDRYIAERKHEEEAARWRAEHIPVKVTAKNLLTGLGSDSLSDLLGGTGPTPHDHVFSSAGRCMWPRCRERSQLRWFRTCGC